MPKRSSNKNRLPLQVDSHDHNTPSSNSTAAEEQTALLPGELTDLIIDYLHNDKRTLQNCALVCRFWLPRSYLYLWSRVSLDERASSMREAIFQQAFKVVHCSFRIAPLIHTMEITSSIVPIKQRTRWLLDRIKRFPQLQKLKMVLSKAPIYNSVISTSVTTLILNDVDFNNVTHLYRFLCAFPNLCDLSLGYSGRYPPVLLGPSPSVQRVSPISHLKRLEFRPALVWAYTMGILFAGITPVIHVDSLRIGRLTSGGGMPAVVLRDMLLKAAGPNLRELEIEAGAVGEYGGDATTNDIEYWLRPIDLSRAVNLRKLSLEIGHAHPHARMTRSIKSILSQLPPTVQEFTFVVSCNRFERVPSNSGSAVVSLLDWAVLAPALKTFYGTFVIRLQYPLVWDTSLPCLAQILPRNLRLEYTTEFGITLCYMDIVSPREGA